MEEEVGLLRVTERVSFSAISKVELIESQEVRMDGESQNRSLLVSSHVALWLLFRPLTVVPFIESDVFRFADFQSHPSDPSLILAVLEDHTKPDPAKVVNSVVLISTESRTLSTVASGNDFYASPKFSPSGKSISFHTWIHPDMPWDGSEVYVVEANVDSNGKINVEKPVTSKPVKVAGKPGAKEAVCQPKWAIPSQGAETLVFSSDRSNWHQLYKYQVGSEAEKIDSLLNETVEEDVTPPDWTFGNSNHAALSDKQWIATSSGGKLRIGNIEDRTSTFVSTRFVSISALQVISPTQVVVIASPADSPSVVAILTLPSSSSGDAKEEVLKISSPAKVDSAYISIGKRITFPTRDGSTGHAIFYSPASKDYSGENGELPPLVAYIHGGPTSASGPGLSWVTQWWTSRGFSFVAVNCEFPTFPPFFFTKIADTERSPLQTEDQLDMDQSTEGGSRELGELSMFKIRFLASNTSATRRRSMRSG